jgi:hypothetical protein
MSDFRAGGLYQFQVRKILLLYFRIEGHETIRLG